MPTTDPVAQFYSERAADIEAMGRDEELRRKSLDWMLHADRYKYTYNFTWMGRPIIKFPSDIVIQQELMWNLKPDLVIETGIAHGGSIIFTASMMEMMGINGEVVGIDVDIRQHNRKLIEDHPMAKRITMYEGSSTSAEVVELVRKHTIGKKCVMVILDSLHSHEHVYNELKAYAPMVTVGSYCVLPDTFIEFFPKGYFSHNRPWDVGDNPYTGMKQYLGETDMFETDHSLTNKAMITETIDGYLRRVK
ncbi:MAG TPA: cephalosporin hydroxylase [Gallionella sp.]|nr:MAG: cephalosporin hydroxylase [Gallionellales bacterium GWA2_54_124]OGT19094.1 MAG: cephalosporin hydroxylase [Gallionellales bacterium RIFOXYD12_FULL_53_10]OGT36025.1 MAG: cephalosporin hydroxylase [Gallionellales bacterium RIFOXYD2_FULL_52_7]HCI53985.1 cephalosporin hydroxylase [Gallionella sp.]